MFVKGILSQISKSNSDIFKNNLKVWYKKCLPRVSKKMYLHLRTGYNKLRQNLS